MTGWTERDMPDQHGRTIVVTGANSGLGLRSSEALARAGATVLMGCRNEAKGKVALDLVAEVATGPEPQLISLDLSEPASIRTAVDAIVERAGAVDVLMNNAGVMAIPLRRNSVGWEMQFATNHLGHFALTGLLMPRLLASGAPRVVTTSSMVHLVGAMRWDDLNAERHYRKWGAYGQSKLANLLFTYELDRKARAAGVPLVAAAAHPGYASTHLQEASVEMAGGALRSLRTAGWSALNGLIGQSDAMGALPQLRAATAPDVEGGQYFGPRLVGWRGLPTRVGSSRRSRREDDGRRLWEISEELTGVRFLLT
ncbi:MAG: short-chain dehydrogenase/reductase [Acidimicrobiales bacterium]|jgi:NAD(P)-dependent dehydrogenase (short-subunit alcohol dehydrogenase family)|nr:short-chain dehydrogenase/reductase [Acidimicrobiales bacterium]